MDSRLRFGSGRQPTRWERDMASVEFWRGVAVGIAIQGLVIVSAITVLRGAFGW